MCLAAATAGPRAQTTDAGAAGGVGTISGHVKLTARVRAPLPSNVYPSRTIGKHVAPTIPEIRNVVVYLKDPGFRGALRTDEVGAASGGRDVHPARARHHAWIDG